MNEVTDQNFNIEINKSNTLTIIDFYTDWCGPCKLISPMVEEIAKEYKDKVTVFKANADNCPDLILKYNIMSVPTLLYLNKNKEVVDQISGFRNKDIFIKKINEILES
jgi:thioredoxin 1